MRLSDWLSETKTTQAVFAARIGRSVASVSRMANGLQKPDLDTLLAIERETAGAVRTKDFGEQHPPRLAGSAA